jgi:hypothetical protein
MTRPKITPEIITALQVLRNSSGTPGTAHQSAMKSAIDILDNAGIFAAIDEATGYDVDPEPERVSRCTCPQGGFTRPTGTHRTGCPGDPAEWGDLAYTSKVPGWSEAVKDTRKTYVARGLMTEEPTDGHWSLTENRPVYGR